VVVGLWIAYLVPHKLRHRQQLLESRTDDRFSAALRVLAVTGPEGSGRRQRADVARAVRPDCAREDQKRTGLLHAGTGAPVVTTPGADNGGSDVDRPHGTQDRIGADAVRRAATLHAAHAAATARRGAAARRRGAIAGVLAAATAVTWVLVAVTATPLLAAVAPSVLLVSVVGLGRRAVVQGQQAEAEWQRRIAEAAEQARRSVAARPGRVSAGGRAVRASATETQAIPQVKAETDRAGRVWSGGREGDSWSPVPVPAPTYTMKASAPRREPAPLGEVEGSTAVRPAAATPTTGAEQPAAATAAAEKPAAEQTAAQQTASAGTPVAPGAAVQADGAPTGSIDLDAVLARRRASGM
jgi:hypothetical protein